MIVPIIGFCLAILLLINLFLLQQKQFIYKNLDWLVVHGKHRAFILAILCLCIGLSLGLVGYFNLLDGGTVKVIRIDLAIAAIALLLFDFWQELTSLRQIIARNRLIYKFIIGIQLWWQHYKTDSAVFLLFSVIAIALMAPMASSEVIFSINDHTSHIGYIVQARLALEEGQFPLRVAPLENSGFRYPGFQFYSQLPYTLGGVIYKFITPQNPYEAYKLMLWASLVLGGFFIFRLSLKLTRSPVASVLAGVAYMAAPYFLNNIHARGAFTEAIAQGLLPIALFYVYQLYQTPRKHYLLLSSLAWFALAITHIITFVFGTLFIILWGGILTLKSPTIDQHKSRLMAVGKAYLWAWFLGLYFLAPVVLESKILAIRRQIEVVNPYTTRWMTPLANLLSPASMPSAPTEFGIAPTYGLHPAIGWIMLGAWGMVFYTWLIQPTFPARLRPAQPAIAALIWVFVVAFLITWSPINIWNILPKQLWVTQFTFRFLTHVMWSGALLTAVAVVLIFRERLDRRHLIFGILVIVMVSRPWLPIPKGTVTVEELLKEPLFRYSGALDYLYNPRVVTLFGGSELPTLDPVWIPGYSSWDVFINHPLVFSEAEEGGVVYPRWSAQDQPVLNLSATVPPEVLQGDVTLLLKIDNQIVSSTPLKTPVLDLSIPFESAWVSGDTFKMRFEFTGSTNDGNPPYLRLQRFYFDGFDPAQTLMPVADTKQFCQQLGDLTECKLTATAIAGVQQLPFLYYPTMQKIWVNGQETQGFPVHYRNFNLLGLRLPPGDHTVQLKFVGLGWANGLSLLAWLGWLGSLFWEPIAQKIRLRFK